MVPGVLECSELFCSSLLNIFQYLLIGIGCVRWRSKHISFTLSFTKYNCTYVLAMWSTVWEQEKVMHVCFWCVAYIYILQCLCELQSVFAPFRWFMMRCMRMLLSVCAHLCEHMSVQFIEHLLPCHTLQSSEILYSIYVTARETREV